MTLFNGVTFRHPVLRINNRDHNIDFYQKLGRDESHLSKGTIIFVSF